MWLAARAEREVVELVAETTTQSPNLGAWFGLTVLWGKELSRTNGISN